ncbi:hypothetical protein OG474_30130 [Kribbella sp. NBC_01505]|uniref:hypothetical protein n=1 Tax=Kribbella sp. NBC_01505 TaxID=2903580 RepID=UPI0038681DFC
MPAELSWPTDLPCGCAHNFECPHDWCPRCEQEVTYDLDVCTKCGRVWGIDF